MLEFNKENFATLADAQAYEYQEDTLKITSGKARSFFVRTGSAATDASGESLGDKWSELRWLQTMIVHPLYSIADGIIGVIESDSYFGMDERTKVGQGNHDLIQGLVDAGFFSVEQAQSFKDLRYSTKTPYADKTQADWDALDAVAPATREASSYEDGNYLITTNNQGLDVIVSTDVDCRVRVDLWVCVDNGNQNDINDYANMGTVGYIKTHNGRGALALSSRKVRMYNKVFVTPDVESILDVSVKKNRG
jgi:hypothetical protein